MEWPVKQSEAGSAVFGGACLRNREERLRQVRTPHQILINIPGNTSSFVDGPDDQALAAAHIAGGEYPFDAGGEFSVFGPGVGSLVALHIKPFQNRFFWPQKTHGQKHKLRRQDLFGTGNLFRNKTSLIVFLPLDADD